MTDTAKTWSINAIQAAMRARGSHWWDPDTMRFFGTRALAEVYQGPGGVYFVTTDKDYDGTRRHTVRKFDPDTAEVETVGEVASLSKAQAVRLAKRAAIGQQPALLVEPEAGGVPYELRGLKVTAEEHKPVTVLEQFVADLATHGNKRTAKPDNAEQLILLAKQHHRLMEQLCNGELATDAEGESKTVKKCRDHIALVAQHVGAKGVIFSGDPRGCTVKLVFADGFTNDFGHEGYCVPTSLQE